jgi:L-asparaginase/Glu-tRNA(Gln) amidotransferase subunit D
VGLGEWSISGRDLDARQFAHRRLHLLLDYTAPVCGNAAQRPHGQVSADGAKNLIDSVDYIVSRVWADEAGRNRAGMVLIQEQQIFAARDAQKGDARPGG